jgi:integrase
MRARTVASYKLVFELFQKSCSKTYLDQIDRRDLLKFAVSLRKDGLSPRTVSNRWQTIQAFLKHHGITGLAKRGDAPKFVEAEADAYSREDIATFLAACTPEQYLLYNFYLCTGFRMQEVIFLQYSDIDFKHKTVSVKVKPDFNFGPKGWECRTVPLTEALAVALEARQSERKASTLVFPTRSGRLNTKHLQALKRIAKRAGLDETQWWLHKFRATFATWHLQAGIDIRTVQMYLGHKDISTTLRYLQPARGTAAQEKFNQTFAGVH